MLGALVLLLVILLLVGRLFLLLILLVLHLFLPRVLVGVLGDQRTSSVISQVGKRLRRL